MKTRLLPALIGVAVLAAGVAITRADLIPGRDGSWVIRRAQTEGSKHNYSATARMRVLCKGHDTRSDVKVTHMRPNKCRMEYTSGDLKGVVVGSDGVRNWRYDPKTSRLVVSSGPVCEHPNERLRLLLHNHRVGLAGRQSVAGRDAYSLVLRPRHSLKISKRLRVDSRAFVVLGQEDYSSRGKLESSTRFTHIRFASSFPDALFAVPADAKVTVAHRPMGVAMSLEKLSKEVGFRVLTPSYVPAGYKFDAHRLYSCPCDHPHESAYVRYTNGLRGISVFQSKVGSACDARCGKSKAPSETCDVKQADRGEVVNIRRGDISVVVVGDANARDLKKMAESLR